jgi:1,4-alpha-glucan branching enzyme
MTSSVEFKLFAPNNQNAALIASFTDWQEIPMPKGEDGYFRTQIDLEDGIYSYKFRIQSQSPTFKEQWIEVIDPYATDIDETKNYGIVRIKDGKQIVDTYIWQHDNVALPDNSELVIYELHIADFSGGENDSNKRGKYQDAIDKLDYLS